ncbi:hypothetical protein EBZ37_13200, partial [bacterium]|nr:hypothetical protein [bacterium]
MFPFRHKRAIGQDSEERAKALLISKGYRILGQNLTYRQGELDLVCEEVRNGRMILIFVEVRKRDPRSWVSPEASCLGRSVPFGRFENIVNHELAELEAECSRAC